jgi:hypothetical protein
VQFRNTYAGALILTPINTNLVLAPMQDLQPIVSGSIEWSFPKTEKLGFAIGGGFYPYGDMTEILGRFAIRKFFASAIAPVGGYWEMTAIGGASYINDEITRSEPLFGLALRLGSLRTTRFGDFGFEYGGGPAVILTRGQTQVRAEFFFGIGYLLGHSQVIER